MHLTTTFYQLLSIYALFKNGITQVRQGIPYWVKLRFTYKTDRVYVQRGICIYVYPVKRLNSKGKQIKKILWQNILIYKTSMVDRYQTTGLGIPVGYLAMIMGGGSRIISMQIDSKKS